LITTSASTNRSKMKKLHSSLFAFHLYARCTASDTVQAVPVRCTLQLYLESATVSPNATLKDIIFNEQFKNLNRFISVVYCVLATVCPVERIFSLGGIFMRPHRAHMIVTLYFAIWCSRNVMLNCECWYSLMHVL